MFCLLFHCRWAWFRNSIGCDTNNSHLSREKRNLAELVGSWDVGLHGPGLESSSVPPATPHSAHHTLKSCAAGKKQSRKNGLDLGSETPLALWFYPVRETIPQLVLKSPSAEKGGS